VSGKFVFESVRLDGSVITNGSDNAEISVIISKKDKDARYTTLNDNVKQWVCNRDVFFYA